MSELRADLAAFASLLEAEWYNGNLDEKAYERLNVDLTGIVAKHNLHALSSKDEPLDVELALMEALQAAGVKPDDNDCAACPHHGSDHDLGNWCLLCPRPPEYERLTFGARIAGGWCYFASMDKGQRWENAVKGTLAALRERGYTLSKETPA